MSLTIKENYTLTEWCQVSFTFGFCTQLMDSGVNGNLGQNAQELAAEEFRRVPARALNPVPRMGEKIAKVV